MSYLKFDGAFAAETVAPVRSYFSTTAIETIIGGAASEGFAGGDMDTLRGDAGDDTYYLQGAGITIVETATGGTDKIVAWQNVNLADHVNIENLEIGGDRTYGAGNARDNVIVASDKGHQIYGGLGQDVLVGGAGVDTFIVVSGEGNDALYNFDAAKDVIRLSSSYRTFGEIQSHMTQVGGDLKIDLGGPDALVLRNVNAGQLTSANFQLGMDTSKLGAVTFADEFNSLSLWNGAGAGTWSTTFWYDNPTGNGGTLHSNNEQQWYINANYGPTSSVKPWTVAGGQLTLTVAPAAPEISSQINGYKYTSGEINTFPSFAQTYGYFEMRADVPDAVGAWPAFWLMPTDGSWPPELDVMEVLTHDPNAVWTTAHSALGGHSMSQAMSYIPDTADGFHTYGVLWTKTDLTWFVDGVEVFKTATPSDMHKPMYMMANLALGGWGGAVDTADLPAQFKIDYIRSYALADGSSTTISKLPPPASQEPPPAAQIPPPVQVPPPVEPPPVEPPPVGLGQVLTSAGPGMVLIGADGADTLNASEGLDTLTGGAGADRFVLGKEPWAPVQVTDFKLGVDKLDLGALLQKAGYVGTDPVADKFVCLESNGHGGTLVRFDRDGAAQGQQWPNTIIDLHGVSNVGLTWAQLQGSGAAEPPPPAPPPQVPPPAAAGLTLTSSGPGSTLAGGGLADTLNASQGLDTLTGGAGADRFVFGAEPWAPVHVTDFEIGKDTLDLSALFQKAGYTGADPVADKYVYFESDGNGGTMVRFDRDAAGQTQQWPNTIIDLRGVSHVGLTWEKLQGGADSEPPPPPPVQTPGLKLTSAGPASVLTGGANADTLSASEGLDSLTGGAGGDHFVFGKEPWAPVHVMDFELGKDVLDLSALFQKAGYAGSDPVADKYVYFESDGAGGTLVRFDRDAAGQAQQWPNTIIDLRGVSHVGLTWQQLQGGWIG